MIQPYQFGLSDLISFFRKFATATWWSQAYLRGNLGSLHCILNPWTSEARENTSTTWDQAIQQEINPLQECKCARTLGPTEWWSSEGLELVTLGVWWHLNSLGDRRLLVSSWSLWEPQEEDLYTVWNLPFWRWRRGILIDHLLFVMQGSSTLCGCSNVN